MLLVMNKLNVAVIGLGTIGGGVSRMLLKNNYPNITLYAICDKDKNRLNEFSDDIKKYQDYKEVLNDKNVEVVVEVMGGERIAFALIKEALEKNINVVSANKEVVAKHYLELSDILRKSNARFMFEASVGGVVPIINAIYNYKRANRIDHIEGIINGSTNYLLTLMQKDGVSFNDAIADAKEKGFLEQDPSSDLKGLDMKRKIVILSNIAYNAALNLDKVYNYSLEGVSDEFIKEVNNNGYILKYMAESNLKEDHVEIRIEPVLVRNDSIYASVLYERNYIAFCGAEQEKIELLGLGAGRYPTSTAIVSDIIQIACGEEKLDLRIDKELKIDNSALTDKYLIDGEINKELIERKVGKFFETKMIERKEIEDNLDKIKFYARIK